MTASVLDVWPRSTLLRRLVRGEKLLAMSADCCHLQMMITMMMMTTTTTMIIIIIITQRRHLQTST